MKSEYSCNRYFAVIVGETDEQWANDTIPQKIRDWLVLRLLLRKAMINDGHNDTSVAFSAACGVPGGGEIPMRKRSTLSSVACPYVGELRTNTAWLFTAKRPGVKANL